MIPTSLRRRCTGYRPILDAAKSFAADKREWCAQLQAEDGGCSGASAASPASKGPGADGGGESGSHGGCRGEASGGGAKPSAGCCGKCPKGQESGSAEVLDERTRAFRAARDGELQPRRRMVRVEEGTPDKVLSELAHQTWEECRGPEERAGWEEGGADGAAARRPALRVPEELLRVRGLGGRERGSPVTLCGLHARAQLCCPRRPHCSIRPTHSPPSTRPLSAPHHPYATAPTQLPVTHLGSMHALTLPPPTIATTSPSTR